jgi:hypothetical protein
MTVKNKLQAILDEITRFENWISNLDIDDTAIAVFDVNYDDVILPGKFNNSLQAEMDRVNALGDTIAFEELQKVKSAFDL